MRLDIPFVETQEDLVLYTDIDVYFNKNISLSDLPEPKYLAAAPEFTKSPKEMTYFNAGVLLLNVKNTRKQCEKIFLDLQNGKPNKSGLFDQGFLNQYCFKEMNLLPIEYNWKPYWGINPKAKIIHYHGMKPGGCFSNSGFCMDEKTLMYIANLYPESTYGLLYYTQLYFNKLGPSEEWLYKFTNQLIKTNKKNT